MEGKGKKGKGMRRAREGKERDQGEGFAGPMSNCFRRACVFCDESCVITADWTAEVSACARDNGGCQQRCVDHNGTATCQCFDGYALARDQIHCQGHPLLLFLLLVCHTIRVARLRSG